jgi:hypothetical protein
MCLQLLRKTQFPIDFQRRRESVTEKILVIAAMFIMLSYHSLLLGENYERKT